MEKDSLVIVSGGMDSITMLYEYQQRIVISVSSGYGSNHNQKEIPLAKMHCDRLGIRHIVISSPLMHDYFKSSLLKGDDAIPEGHYEEENVKSTVAPFRNGITLAVDCGSAISNHLKYVMIANHGGDHTIYPDCRPELINSFSQAMAAGTSEGITILAPYTQISKGEIALRGEKLGVNYAETWSCYKGGDRQCDKCGTCVERKEALAFAGINNGTPYEDQKGIDNKQKSKEVKREPMWFFQRLLVTSRNMTYCVSRRTEVSAAHRLSLFYESKRQCLHGHNQVITVYLFRKDKLDANGMVFDFTHTKKAIHNQLDHTYISDVIPYNPTAEDTARWAANQFDECYKAEMQEGERNVAQAIDETKIVGIENLVM